MLTLHVISIFNGGGGVEIRICLFPDPPPPGNKLFLSSRGGVVLMPAIIPQNRPKTFQVAKAVARTSKNIRINAELTNLASELSPMVPQPLVSCTVVLRSMTSSKTLLKIYIYIFIQLSNYNPTE